MSNFIQLLLNAVLVYWGTQALLHLVQAVRLDEKRKGNTAPEDEAPAPFHPNDRLPWRRMIGPVYEAHFKDVIGDWDAVIPRTPPSSEPKPRGRARS